MTLVMKNVKFWLGTFENFTKTYSKNDVVIKYF